MGVTLKYLHAGHAPFQIDANMGFTSAVYEMLLYSDLDKIKLLPALPADFKKGKVEGIQARGGYSLSIQWSENQLKAEILAKCDGQVNVCAKGYTLQNDTYQSSKYGSDYRLISFKKGERVSLVYTK